MEFNYFTLLTAAMMMVSSVPAFAQESVNVVESEASVGIEDYDSMYMVVPDEVAGMDEYLSLNENGGLELDVAGALAAGYTEAAVYGVNGTIHEINEKVYAGEAVLGENYFAYSTELAISPCTGPLLTIYGYSGTLVSGY